jgi:hypothetical protein
LYYLALRKKAILSGLWRMAGGHHEQIVTQRLLGNNFSEPRWKTAALKNAYALMGKHRFGKSWHFPLQKLLLTWFRICCGILSPS